MKKVILAQARVAEDKETKERIVFATFLNLPSKGSNNKVWYPLKADLTVVCCFGEDRAPEKFALLRKAMPGTLMGITYGFNERTNKPFVQDVIVLKEGYSESDIYDEINGENPMQ